GRNRVPLRRADADPAVSGGGLQPRRRARAALRLGARTRRDRADRGSQAAQALSVLSRRGRRVRIAARAPGRGARFVRGSPEARAKSGRAPLAAGKNVEPGLARASLTLRSRVLSSQDGRKVPPG